MDIVSFAETQALLFCKKCGDIVDQKLIGRKARSQDSYICDKGHINKACSRIPQFFHPNAPRDRRYRNRGKKKKGDSEE